MKLSKRINYIILPILSIIFTAAGVISYNSQKDIVLSSLEEKLKNESSRITEELTNEFINIDSLLKQFLNSVEVTNYLIDQSSNYEVYSTESQLIRFISSINKSTGNDIQLHISDKTGDDIFYFNSNDPFSEHNTLNAISDHISYIDSQLDDEHSNLISTTSYGIQPEDEGDHFKLNVYKTFSPEQSIYDNSFSRSSILYTATMSLPFRISKRFIDSLEANFSEGTQLSILPINSIVDISELKNITFKSEKIGAMSSINGLYEIKITLPDHYIERLLLPYQLAILSLVVNVTLVCFFLLRLLIRRQVIYPIEHLTKQVEKALKGDQRALSHIQSEDEVSILNNSYIKLLEDLNILAHRDALTGLANRSVFRKILINSIAEAKHTSTICALYFIDLDNFKHVNDTYGHHVGDKLLIEFSKQLSECFSKFANLNQHSIHTHVARIAGDEFAVALPNIEDTHIISVIAEEIVSICKDGIKVDGQRLDVHVSVGIAISPNDAQDAETLMHHADVAMYQMKRGDKNGFHFYSEKLGEELMRHSHIEKAIKESLASESFYLAFMPIYACDSLEVVGFETLLRSNHPLLKELGPDHFIPVAEHCGLIEDIDNWVIDKSLFHMQKLIVDMNFRGKIAINFSSWELNNDQFGLRVQEKLQQYTIPPSQVELEITETCLVTNNARILQRLSELKKLGVSLALDDFGTGYTAFSQLQHYPIDCLKVDRSFVWAIDSETKSSRALVDVIIELASLYNLNVVAEGIETQEQLEYVTKLGCNEVQGYFLSKPVDWQGLLRLLEKA